jgi:hypothetical protein
MCLACLALNDAGEVLFFVAGADALLCCITAECYFWQALRHTKNPFKMKGYFSNMV